MSTETHIGGWRELAVLQTLIGIVLFHDYLTGARYFAFMDIGSDTITQFVPALKYLADPAHWNSAWSFNVGLGNMIPLIPTPFTLLGIAAGPGHVLDMRIWVYLAKIFAGGAAFYGFVDEATKGRREIALLAGLSYSFCGFVVTDGQWDGFSVDFVAYAVLLWAIARHGRRSNPWLIPAGVAFAACSATFFFSVGVFIFYAFLAAAIASDRPRHTCLQWLRSILPQCALGMLLAAPVILPEVFRLLDSPRITGAQAGFAARLMEMFSVNDRGTVFVELAGLFHKNILGVGNLHAGWMNYLEGPGYFVGVLPLLLIPQLWRGTRTDRRIVVAGVLTFGLFVMLPAIRYMAFGFALDYFRVNNLWISLLLLAMFARALHTISTHGIDRWLLIGTGAVLALLLLLLEAGLRPYVSIPHALMILVFLVIAVLLGLSLGRLLPWRIFMLGAIGLVGTEAILISYPSFHANRVPVTRQTPGYSDGTLAALAYLKARDPGFYRVEKNYHSVWLNDAVVQDYRGVKSYWFQGSGMVRFHTDLGLLPRTSPVKNFTNWLQNFGGRFVLNSLVGVKYLIARTPLDWAGFRQIHEVNGLIIYQNDLALPLGVVYDRQFPHDRFVTLTPEMKDITMMNAVILDEPRGTAVQMFDVGQLGRQSNTWLEDNYADPARKLQGRGLQVEQFSDGHITGRIASDTAGVLVFSIPYAKGWTVAIDGEARPVFRANLGFMATDIASGAHRVELRYALPGLVPGLILGFLGLLVLVVRQRRAPAAVHRGEPG